MMIRLSFMFLVLSLVSGVSFADGYFNNLRDDQTIPADCRDTEMRDFTQVPEHFTVSINGAKKRGFTYEFPLTRKGGHLLWKALKGGALKALQKYSKEHEPVLKEYYNLAKEYGPKMGFKFGSEGEVLEVLAILKFYDKYDAKKYFVTGSVEYHGLESHSTIGELDVVIGERETCRVIAFGEVKLGVRSLGKAEDQTQRFLRFLKGVKKRLLK